MTNKSLADVDAETLEKLTKQDMVDFYTYHISTSSSKRAKLSVHLQAQAKPKELPLSQKQAAAISSLKIILGEHKITYDEGLLAPRVNAVSSAEGIPDAIALYLTEDLQTSKEVTEQILDEAKAALGVADSGLPAEPQLLDEAADVSSVTDASHPVLIKDVHAWKASMQVSSGVRPTRNLEEFVEVTEKL